MACSEVSKQLDRDAVTLSLPMSQWTSFADGADSNQTAQNVQSVL